MEKSWHSLELKDVFKELDSNDKGLSEEQAKERLEKFGQNELKAGKKISPLEIFISQFKDTLILILIVAAVISAGIGLLKSGNEGSEELIDAATIFMVVILIAVIGFIQEYKAAKELEALKKMVSPEAVVMRNGQQSKIPAKEIVPGDVILIEAGDKIPADCRIIESINMRADEAALTGESMPIEKEEISNLDDNAALGDRRNMLFMGTHVTYGKGKAIVVKTGMSTEFGKIAERIQEIEQEETPLQISLEKVGKKIGMLVLAICAIVFIAGLVKSNFSLENLEMLFLTAVALAVAAIPEGLPGVVIITLARGMRRMVKKNAIVRTLSAVETLGSTTVICSDKTGTLTRNEMVVRKIFVDNAIIDVTGEGYKPEGKFLHKGREVKAKEGDLSLLLKIAALCNNSALRKDENMFKIIGDPTEGALVVLAEKGCLTCDELKEKHKRVGELPFDSESKRMTTIHDLGRENVAYMKGAPDIVLELCDRIYENGIERKLTASEKKKILEMNDKFAQDALRVLAFAYKRVDKKEKINRATTERNMVFVGLTGMLDPPREDAKNAIAVCREAGIKIVMITGDHKITAMAVGKEMDILREGDKVLTGQELDKISDEELEQMVEDVKIYARVSPEHKLRIVTALKNKGEVVAMTGDGVNDAPALKRADIGIAMGITGTEVTKEASNMILLDDNFASIVSAVEEGRGIYDNIRLFIRYLLSCNIGEVLVIFFGILLFPILPLLPIQLLLMNLVTDAIPAISLGFNPPDKDVMKRKPRDSKEEIIDKKAIFDYTKIGVIATILTLGVFWLELPSGDQRAQTMAFTTLVLFQHFFVLSCRSEKKTLLSVGIFSNKWLVLSSVSSMIFHVAVIYVPVLQALFKTVPLSLFDWALLLGVTSLGLIIPELEKVVRRRL